MVLCNSCVCFLFVKFYQIIGHGWGANGKNAAQACCACGGGAGVDADLDIDAPEDEFQGGDKDVNINDGDDITCGCPLCTSDILDTVAEDKIEMES